MTSGFPDIACFLPDPDPHVASQHTITSQQVRPTSAYKWPCLVVTRGSLPHQQHTGNISKHAPACMWHMMIRCAHIPSLSSGGRWGPAEVIVREIIIFRTSVGRQLLLTYKNGFDMLSTTAMEGRRPHPTHFLPHAPLQRQPILSYLMYHCLARAFGWFGPAGSFTASAAWQVASNTTALPSRPT